MRRLRAILLFKLGFRAGLPRGRVAIRVPPGWRAESTTRALAGGVAGDAAFGGVAVGAKPARQ